MRISIALRVCLAHQCRCGATVKSDGRHPPSCRFSDGRFPRHSAISNIMKRSLDTACLYSILELVTLDRDDGRRPDEVTYFPFKGGKALAWEATCSNSFSHHNLCSTIFNPGSASSTAEDLKRRKYYQFVADFELVPVAAEASGISRMLPLTDIGRRILRATNDPRQISFIFQQISVPSIEASHWLWQPHQGDMPMSWLRDTDIQNEDALHLCYASSWSIGHITSG